MMRLAAGVAVAALAGLAAARPQDTQSGPGLIDAYFADFWASEKITSGPPADDHQFFRRVTLDLYGRLPKIGVDPKGKDSEILAFVDDRSPDKRARWIERMLASDECADFMADVWLDALIDYEYTGQDIARTNLGALRGWLRRGFYEDVPYNAMVRALLSDRGPRLEKPAVNFALKHMGVEPVPVKLAVMSARLFLARDIRCAQCHDHPWEDLAHEDFWAYLEFFRPLRSAGERGLIEMEQPHRGPPRQDLGEPPSASPRFLDGRAPEPGGRLGESLAEFTLTTGDHACSKAFVDRMWKHFFGRRLKSQGHAKGHDALLNTLALWFERNGWSPRKLMRAIVNSRVYQLASDGREERRGRYALGPVKVMNPVQFFRVYMDIFDLHAFMRQVQEKVEKSDVALPALKDQELRYLEMYAWARNLLLPKGQDPEETAGVGTTRMALRFMNNRKIQQMINFQWGLLKRVLGKTSRAEDRVRELVMAMYGRPPTADEFDLFVRYVRSTLLEQKAFEDVMWVLLNSSEFLFNH